MYKTDARICQKSATIIWRGYFKDTDEDYNDDDDDNNNETISCAMSRNVIK